MMYFNSESDYIIFKDKLFNFKEESIKYCMGILIVLQKILINTINTLKELPFKNLINLFHNSNSISAFSHKVFFKFYAKGEIHKKLKIEIYSYIKNSFFGGRCEIFGNPLKDELVHYFDYSGMYGQCMLEKFPLGNASIEFGAKIIDKPGFYYIKFYQDLEFPILPTKIGNKLMFINGDLEGLYWFEEINLFLKYNGVINEIVYSLLYEKSDYIFKSFVEDFNLIRHKGGYKKVLGKLIINSLYGSFGLKEDETFTKLIYSEKEFLDILENLNTKSFLKTNNCYLVEIIKDKQSQRLINKQDRNWNSEFSERNVGYASIITSKARIKLYKALMCTIEYGGRLLYTDTDSIFAAFKKANSNIGEIIWEELYEDACFILPKFYMLKKNKNEIIKIKGVENYNLSYDEIKNIFYNSSEDSKIEMIPRKGIFNLGRRTSEKILWVNKYDKRRFINEKKSSKAFFVNEIC